MNGLYLFYLGQIQSSCFPVFPVFVITDYWLQPQLWSIKTIPLKITDMFSFSLLIQEKKIQIWLSEFPPVGNDHSVICAVLKKTFYN